MPELRLVEVPDRNDGRGASFYIPPEAIKFVERIDEVHFAALEVGAVRGNHYHIGRREFIFVEYSDQWQLAWRARDDSEVHERVFRGTGGVLLMVEPGVVHAIKNIGALQLYLISCSDRRHADTFSETLLK